MLRSASTLNRTECNNRAQHDPTDNPKFPTEQCGLGRSQRRPAQAETNRLTHTPRSLVLGLVVATQDR